MTTNRTRSPDNSESTPSPTYMADAEKGPGDAMLLSAGGKNWLKAVEQLRLMPYDDQTGRGIDAWVIGATIGYGHLILQSEWGLYRNGISEAQAEQLLDDDVGPFVALVNDVIVVAMRQNEFDAALMLAYNIGGANFSASSVAKLINDPSSSTPYASLENAWKAWNKSEGVVNTGLVNRRDAEWEMYADGIYQTW